MNYTIGENYTLPSEGKIYDVQINPNVKLRSMTVNEEMKRLGHSDRPLGVMSEIIDDCLIDKPGISSYDMCLADYQFLLHKLRVVTYGPDYKLSVICPYCGNAEETTINLDELEVSAYNDEVKKDLEFDLPRSKRHITLKVQTPRILDNVSIKMKDVKKKQSKTSLDPALSFTLESLIDTVDGVKINVVEKEEFVRNLEMMDANYIMKKAEKANVDFGISPTFDNECSECGLAYKSPFRQTSEFFGPSID